MLKNYLSHTHYIGLSNLQLQSRIAGASQHHYIMLSCAAVPIRFATAACKPLCRSVAPNRPTCVQCWQWGQFRSMLRPSYSNGSFVKANSRYSLLHIFRTWSSKSAPNVIIFVTFWNANQTLASPVRFLATTFPDRRGNTDPTAATPGATIPVKTQGFAPENVFTREFTRSQTLSLPNYLMTRLTWWCRWHDGVMLTMTTIRNSEVFLLNFLWMYDL